MALHTHKRDLANSLLEGTETAARVSADDLMELLQEVFYKTPLHRSQRSV